MSFELIEIFFLTLAVHRQLSAGCSFSVEFEFMPDFDTEAN